VFEDLPAVQEITALNVEAAAASLDRALGDGGASR